MGLAITSSNTMSASKKITTKSTKSPAPATKSVASTSAAKKKSAPVAATVRTATATPVAMLAPTPARVAVAAPAVKPVASKPVSTTIKARVDVGFGNSLYLRGEGPGLSWDKGFLMQNTGADLWQVVLAESARAYTFKFLVNDITWSTGPDYTAACGTSVTLNPEF